MKYFIIFTLLAFLAVMGYLDLLKYIIRARTTARDCAWCPSSWWPKS